MTKLLSTEQMAEFANSGCLFFEGLIDEDINKEFLNDIGHTAVSYTHLTLPTMDSV